MKYTLNLRNIAIGTVLIYVLQLAVGCANIVPPVGGPRDSIPPYLTIARPKDSATGIKPKEIQLVFSEYISTTDLPINFIISPSIKTTPLIDSRLNAIRIRINDSLAPNTTYSLQFGNAIRDVNEGNIAKNYTYVFSTGDHIDTGRFSGNVHIAETGNIDSTLIVLLHPVNNDTAIYKNSPQYYSKINGKGKFEFKFLPYQSFQVFVLPNDYNKKYDDSTKLIAFLDNPIQVTATTDTQNLYAFQAFKKIEIKKAVTGSKVVKAKSTALKYNKLMEGGDQDLLNPLQLNFDGPIKINDSFPILLCDTNNKAIVGYTVSIDSSNRNLFVHYNWEEQTKFHLIIPKGSIYDSNLNTIQKSDTLKFTTKSEAAYGSLLIRLSGFQQIKNPVLLFTQEDKVKYSFPISQSLIRIPKILPGDFILKILEDENNNGKWDTGKFGKIKQQPEHVKFIGTTINIKANWDNEFNVVINK